MKKAAIYARYSTDRQNESSITDQVRVCTDYAKAHKLKIVATYEDKGISGAAIGNRPGMRALIEAAKKKQFEIVLLTDTSRLSRSLGDLAKTLDRFTADGVQVLGTQEAFDSFDPNAGMQAGMSGIMSEQYRRMIKQRTHAALETRAKANRPTGGKAYGYVGRKIDTAQAAIVREIFRLYASGKSERAIANELNGRKVPSPGATWRREERRRAGWMGSAVRAILRNDIYSGRIVWNRSRWVKDPDSGVRKRVERPESEWVTHQDESLRIVDAKTWEAVQRRINKPHAYTTHSGGKPKYLLAGLLRCSACGAAYVLDAAKGYRCASLINGGQHACSNHLRVRRPVVEDAVIGAIMGGLLSPAMVAEVAKEVQRKYNAAIKAHRVKAEELPTAIRELDARLARLRKRLAKGDPDMEPDEIQSAIERAEAKRAQLAQAPRAKEVNLSVLVPRAAEEYRTVIADAIAGKTTEAAARARPLLRELLGGPVRMVPGKQAGELWAEFELHPARLVRTPKGGSVVAGASIVLNPPCLPVRKKLRTGRAAS